MKYKVSVRNASCFDIEEVKYFETMMEAKLFRNMIWRTRYQFTKLEEVTGNKNANEKPWSFCVKGVNGVTLAFKNIGEAERFFGMGVNTLRTAFNMTKKQMYKGAKVYFDYAKPTILSTVTDDVKKSMFYEKRGKQKVKVTDLNGKEVIFNSIKETAKEMHIAITKVYEQAKKEEKYKGYYYEFVEG